MKSAIDDINLLLSAKTEQDQLLDEITNLAAYTCDCRVGLIVLLGSEKQVFKSSYGFDLKETPLEYSVCQKIKQEKLDFLLIEDLHADQEFQGHPAYQELGIRFYAGYPLKSESGEIFGTCCVLDYEPKTLTTYQIKNLGILTKQVSNLIEIHKQNYQVKKEKEKLEIWKDTIYDIAKVAKIGAIIIDYTKEKIVISDYTRKFLEIEETKSYTFEWFLQLEHTFSNAFEELLVEVKRNIREHNSGNGVFNYQLNRQNRSFQVNYSFNETNLTITFKDISSISKLEHDLLRYKSLMEEVERQRMIGAWEFNIKENSIFWTQNTYKIYGISTDTPLTLDFVKSFYPDDSYIQMENDFSACIATGNPYSNIYRFKSYQGELKWVKVVANPLMENGVVQKVIGSFQDVTEDTELKIHLNGTNVLLEKRTLLLESLVNNNTFFIFRMTSSREIVFVNEYYKTHFGFEDNFEAGQMVDTSVLDEISLKESEKMAVDAINNPGNIYRAILKQYTKKGKEIYCEWDVVFLGDQISEGLLWIGRDITEQIKQKKELSRITNLTSFLNAKLVEFNNITSHLFRGQIANLAGIYRLIELSHSYEEKIKFLNLSKSCLDKIEEIITDLDAITRIDLPQSAEYEPIDVRFMVLEVINKYFPYFNNEFNTLKVLIPDDFLILSAPYYIRLALNQIFSFSYKNRNKELPFDITIKAFQESNDYATLELRVYLPLLKEGFEDQDLGSLPELEAWKLKSSSTLMELINGHLSISSLTQGYILFKLTIPNVL
ncbi:PAS domain S-box protein [Algoriphagus sp. AK58]|uniref:PAS domain S-box protein n=1 Tax=Algoriphagus sp. AK58 TaxID=1406877 RepID=UPI00164EE6D7|nr:PAS domain S-box protein [Algoriphagus sp. AK58]MBC6365816.1 hypothetical protein [Algoriphagus sp. AK58]